MKLLLVSNLATTAQSVYTKKWMSSMKLLLVSKLDRAARAVRAVTKYVELGISLGHEVAVFGEPNPDLPSIPYSLDVKAFDFALFVIYETWDFPDLPHLAHLLDGVPKSRRVIIDCTGRYNETIRVEHDFNHLERLDGHQGWEWVEGLQAVSDKILQPTLSPLSKDVRPFLFFGYDPSAVNRSYSSSREAAQAWSGTNGEAKRYGLAYVGNNWQRWSQVKSLLEAIEPIRTRLGPVALRGWAWDQRPDWAVEHGFAGLDLDPALLKRLEVDIGESIGFHEVVDFQGQARFCPVIHRPLFKRLGLVTNRTFETFTSDTIPLLMLSEEFIESIYGKSALPLAAGSDVAKHIESVMSRPEFYWDAVLSTRSYLAERHSYERRFEELLTIMES